MDTFDCVVVGAGVHGLCTAFWLRRRGLPRIAVLEQFGVAHDRGASHGSTRITRSSYAEPEHVALATRAHRQAWPELERCLGQSLRTPTPGVFFGPATGPIRAYAEATAAAAAAVEALPVATARQRFPLLRFADDDLVLVDHTAAVVHASALMQGLREWLGQQGVDCRFHTPVLGIVPEGDRVHVTTTHGALRARHVVLATGAWLPRLSPGAPTTTPLRQQVGYFELAAPPTALRAGSFPVWARVGIAANDFQYGLPATDERGVKCALHRTEGAPDDLTTEAPALDAGALLELARARFAVTVRRCAATERCLYAMHEGQRLTVERDRPGIVRIAACSGHAFKFGPVIGQLAADLVHAS